MSQFTDRGIPSRPQKPLFQTCLSALFFPPQATTTSFVLWMLVEKPMANVVDLLVRGPAPR